MDLSTVETKLINGDYETIDEFAEDIRLIWSNAEKYNGPTHSVTIAGQKLSEDFEKKFLGVKKKESNLSVRAPRVKPTTNLAPQAQAGGLKIRAKINLQTMSYEEKKQLCIMINNLESKHLPKIVQIIHKGTPTIFQGMDSNVEEIEININSLDTATLRELERYAKNL